MKILVPVKRVVSYNVKVRVKLDSTGVDTADVKVSMGPLDEIAVEEAIRLKEKGVATEVVAISCGVTRYQETLRTAMTIDANRSILVETDAELQPLAAAKLLKVLVSREQPTLILLNKRTVDGDMNQTSQMLVALVGLSQATCASKIDVIGNEVTATREVDGGFEAVSLTLPAVITTDLHLNEPRYVTLPNTAEAEEKPLNVVRPEDLSMGVASYLKTLKVSGPPKRSADVMVTDMAALVEKLKNETKVI